MAPFFDDTFEHNIRIPRTHKAVGLALLKELQTDLSCQGKHGRQFGVSEEREGSSEAVQFRKLPSIDVCCIPTCSWIGLPQFSSQIAQRLLLHFGGLLTTGITMLQVLR